MVCGDCFDDYTLPGVQELLLCTACAEELRASPLSEEEVPEPEPEPEPAPESEPEPEPGADDAPKGGSAPPEARDAPPSSPWEVLGVAPGTPLAEVKRAYLALITQYHPDKVAQLGPKLQGLAAEETRRLNEAWSELRRRVGQKSP
jgi:DnaJ-domain-containing protein 1